MLIETKKTKTWLIGDPHFGRDFRNGCPLNRRGDRERMQRALFKEELATPDVDTVVMVGDLFNQPVVPLAMLSQVIHDVIEAAEARPDVTFIYMAGNHDLSRVLTEQGAWEIFSLAVGWMENVVIADQVLAHHDLVCFPWDWVISAEEQVERYTALGPVSAAVGHWDMMSFGGDESHLCPVDALREAFGEDVEIYSGHYHEERDYVVGGVTIHCVGSMQPYAHGEGDMYVTLTATEAVEQAEQLTNKVVRIRLQPGEVMPVIDCLQLTGERVGVEGEEAVDGSDIELDAVGATSFNLDETLNNNLDANEVPDPVRVYIKEKIGAAA
jgi:hypothetical protein